MKFQGFHTLKATIAALAFGIVLAGCSAGGATKTTDNTDTPTAASLNVSVDKNSITSTGSDTATITVTALDSSNNVVSSIPVSITPDSGVLTPSGASTDTNGVLTAALTIGGDHSNRTIVVVISSGSIKKTLSIAVTGATLNASVGTGAAGAAATIQYTLVDASSAAIPDASITVKMAGQTDVVGKTDVNGKYPFPFTVPSTSSTVSATAAGVTLVSTVTPTNSTTVVPDAAAVTSPSLSANPTSVSTGHQVELRALFIGANNAPIQNVRARFQMVDSNSIGGSLSSDSSDGVTHNVIYSDVNGVARSTYTAGTRGGVITAKVCWDRTDFASTACPNEVTASSVTVVASGVNLAVLANGILGVDDAKNIYSLSFVVQVVDASSQPISGSTVTGAVDIPRFYRGAYGIAAGKWSPSIYSDNTLSTLLAGQQSCDNEDINRNNVMEGGEDLNGSLALEPFKASITITPTNAGSNVTDAFGKAYFTLQYGQNYASWEDVALTFTTTVEGTEGHAPYETGLPVPSAVLTTITADPPFKVSPYNVIKDGLPYPWLVGTTSVANPGVIYPTTATFNLCNAQQ
ncbi:MAG: Ig-like domain-containing protein [Betaproteobacteria bacterium]